ncbi:MAG: thioredoxin-dependent thiol peroxidase [Bacteriovoracaceae bacterium]
MKGESLRVGDQAPGFTLKDQNGKEVSLSDFRGRNVVVYFYPKALTPGCTVQACGIRDVWKELAELDVVVLGISADSPDKLKKFQEKKELNFTLLSDPDKTVINAYRSWGPKKFMGREFDGILRQSFFIDREGKIASILHKVDTAHHHETIVDFFKNRK